MRLTLSRGVSLAVLASARTEAAHHEELGCSVLGPPSRRVRRAHGWLKRLGSAVTAARAVELVKALEQTSAYAALCDGSKRRYGRRLLREDVLFPRAERWAPTVLHLRRDELGLDVPVRRDEWPLINVLFSTLARGASSSELRALAVASGTVAGLIDDLRGARWLEAFEAPPAKASVVHVGHNTTLVRGRRATVLVDPYFRPASRFDLPSYQPMQPRDLGPVDAVLITHSHGDHFHLGSLLQLPPETRFFVPPVERESLFSTDCALRLRQLGFRNVEALPWWSSREVGDVTVQAMPFYGEQPTDDEGVYRGLRNVGSTWRVEAPRVSAAFFADTGHDAHGDMASVCKKAEPVDVLFCGVRGFRLKPIFFSHTTLVSYLVDVPLALLTTPQELMADGPQALRYAKLLGAKKLVPCADGGAPWYWREGMGPKYPGYPGELADGASPYEENPDADPYPERVKGRGVHVLRPGDALGEAARGPFRWPFGKVL
ncbi:MAG: MBL fold metallo-hydrolase [Myxococcaceae bacterium]|nr:MBL fold metallo-hydrolase [Myxococcaceae bacterium]